ncbi:MAG: TetR family transcriptional regulator [Crocinitomicaceae bacterium]|nr:TetR family transcriptional regulator [Crocinitomicaceae bacterium]|tara:strand:- start:1165 stop:1722 length:558 start_codon:yes stop_codon:yes gene_type:complete
METKDQIVETANTLLVERGYNAFSYKNISEKIGIKTSSIHYHFPTKADLGVAVIQKHVAALQQTIQRTKNEPPASRLNKLFLYYQRLANDSKVCIVGAIASEITTLEAPVRTAILAFSNCVIDWTTSILTDGIEQQVFKKITHPRLKAKQIISSLMALVQIARMENDNQPLDQIPQLILEDLTPE